ncbi:MAG: LysR family transcriptional regulator, partial [Ramlibacter sp.]|nr:LysR family transcriptional regulator [Ramlibacter sp.]
MNLDHLHDQLNPANLRMLQAIADHGSFAAAARELDLVPSALSYRVRQLEDALDVLLFNRQGRRAIPTAAGLELLQEGARLLTETGRIAQRVRRIATGWESHLSIVMDNLIDSGTVLEL